MIARWLIYNKCSTGIRITARLSAWPRNYTTFWNCRLRKNAERWSATMQSYRGIGCRRIVTATYARSNTSFSKRVWTCMNNYDHVSKKTRERIGWGEKPWPYQATLGTLTQHLESTRVLSLPEASWDGDEKEIGRVQKELAKRAWTQQRLNSHMQELQCRQSQEPGKCAMVKCIASPLGMGILNQFL